MPAGIMEISAHLDAVVAHLLPPKLYNLYLFSFLIKFPLIKYQI